MKTLRLTRVGDDREREYPVTYEGTANFYTALGDCKVALIQHQGDEHLVMDHPEFGWSSVASIQCRDFDPPIDQDRLDAAS